MSNLAGVDRPAEATEAEISVSGRGISVTSVVESVEDAAIVVRPSAAEHVDQVTVRPGDAVVVFWANADGHRALPAEVTDVVDDAGLRWHLRATGPADQVQRRMAVRGRVAVLVEARFGEVELVGETVDISEGGLRARFTGSGTPPESGAALQLSVRLDEGTVETAAEVVRNQVRGAVWLLSTRFTALAERDQDRIRRRVFQALREERARSAGIARP